MRSYLLISNLEAIEEELFYPAVRQEIDDEDIMHEADEEHHVAKLLIAELENMTGDEEHWEAKFMVLAEAVRHHIKEEEGEMFPKARKTNIDFVALGERMSALKKRLMEQGVPQDAEAKMISKYGLRGDSPAVKAKPSRSHLNRNVLTPHDVRARSAGHVADVGY